MRREKYRRIAERAKAAEAAKQREIDRIHKLEQLAGEVEVTQKHSRWIALLPFGIGQFQNGQRAAGYVFLVAESLFAATGIATVPFYYVALADAHDAYKGPSSTQVVNEYNDRANAARYVNLSAYGALALSVVVGAIEAEATYVPNVVTTVPRGLPPTVAPPAPLPPISFEATPLPGRDGRGAGGVSIGVTFAF